MRLIPMSKDRGLTALSVRGSHGAEPPCFSLASPRLLHWQTRRARAKNKVGISYALTLGELLSYSTGVQPREMCPAVQDGDVQDAL